MKLMRYAEPLVTLCNDLLAIDIREATGRNDGLPAELFAGGRIGEAWCAHFVLWAFRTIDLPIPGDVEPSLSVANPLTSVKLLLHTFAEHEWLTQTPQPGDVMFSRRVDGGLHVGIVIAVNRDMQYLTCCEGNTSNRLRRLTWLRHNPRVLVFGRRPDFGEPIALPENRRKELAS